VSICRILLVFWRLVCIIYYDTLKAMLEQKWSKVYGLINFIHIKNGIRCLFPMLEQNMQPLAKSTLVLAVYGIR
jgi:hypothetical protein